MKAVVAPIEDADAFLRAWAQAAPAARFFTSTAWIGALLDAWPATSTPFQVRVDAGGAAALVGLVGRPARASLLSLAEARLNETGDPEMDRIYIEFNDFSVAGPHATALRRAAIGAIADSFDVDQLVFRNAREPVVEAARAVASERGLALEALAVAPTFEVALPAADFSRSMRASIERSRRHYEGRGEIRVASPRDDTQRRALWEKLRALHGARWRAQGEGGAFASPEVIAFHEALMQRAPHATDLLAVEAGDHTIGVLYNFVHDGAASNYQSGFTREEDTRLTPGYLCHALACRHYADRGFGAYSLLAGEAKYKRRLGAPGEGLQTVAIMRRTWRQSLRAAVKRARAGRTAETRRT